MGPLSEHTTFDSEGVGVLLCLHLLQQHIEELNSRDCLANLDGRSVIEATQKPRMGSGQHLIDEIHKVAKKMAIDSDEEKAFTLVWVPGHCGLRGNELADLEAKEATVNGSSGVLSLPLFLRNPLPASLSTVKQTFNKHLSTQWQRRFESSPQYQRFLQVDKKGIKSDFQKETIMLSRRQTSLLVQLRTAHIPLNAHLHRIHKSETPHCPHCSLQNRHIPELVKHFIFECPAYAKERFWMRGKLGRKVFSLKELLTKEKHMKVLLNYVGKTKRLKKAFGDVTSSKTA